MKRQKRDLTTRAFERGYRVGQSGKSKTLCPTESGSSRQHWLTGWRLGRADYWDGFQGVAGIHCSPHIP